MLPHCSSDFHFSKSLVMLRIFPCASWPSACLLWRNVYLGLLPIFDWVVFSSISYLYILEINPLLVALLADIFSYVDFGNNNQILAAADTYEQTFISQKVTPFDTSSLPGILGCRPGWWWWPHESAGTSCGRDTLDSISEWQWLPMLLLRLWQ